MLPISMPIIVCGLGNTEGAKLSRALGGIAAVGQLQLLQPFFGLALAATLLGETVGLDMLVVSVAVVLCVFGARQFAR